MAINVVFGPEIAEAILEHIASGRTLISFCKDNDIGNMGSIIMWNVNPYAAQVEYGWVEKYATAKKAQREVWAEMAAEASFEVENGKKTVTRTGGKFAGVEVTEYDNVERSKLKADTFKWFLARLDRGKYGDQPTKMGTQDEPGVYKVKIVNDPEG